MEKVALNKKGKSLSFTQMSVPYLRLVLFLFLLINTNINIVYAQCATTIMTTTAGASVTDSGFSGLCLGCSISNTGNVTNASTTDFASIGVAIGVLSSGFIEVTLPQTYPAGTRVGFVVDVNGGLGGLLNGTTLIAYNGNTQVGSASGGSLINVLGIGGGTNVNAVFCQPFNKIRIQVGSLAGVFANYRIFYAYVNTGCSFPVQCGGTASPEFCFDNIDNDGDGLVDSEDVCAVTCLAGVTAPTLTTTTKSNLCPSNTVDLTTISATNLPVGATLTWHTGTPATTANKVTGTAVMAGTYYAAFFDAANNCYSRTSSTATSGSATTVVTATVNSCVLPVAGTIDCSKTQIFPAPVAGVAGQKTLIVTINVTSPGCFTPITVSGSGMSVANGLTQVCALTTGIQTFSIPVNYDGSTLGTMNFTVGNAGNAGTCSANLTNPPKKAISEVWTLDCVPTVAPSLK